jgi:hypothetical protein
VNLSIKRAVIVMALIQIYILSTGYKNGSRHWMVTLNSAIIWEISFGSKIAGVSKFKYGSKIAMLNEI